LKDEVAGRGILVWIIQFSVLTSRSLDSHIKGLWKGEGEQSRKPLLRLRRTPLPVGTLQMTPCRSSMQADWANTSTS